jgi:amino acid permease
MAAKPVSKQKKIFQKPKKEQPFPLERENFIIIGIGILLLVIGYIFMSQNSVDGFLPTVVAPILLVLGYCVVIPYGILKRSRKKAEGKETVQSEEVKPAEASNIKTA